MAADRESIRNVVDRRRHLENVTRADHAFEAPEHEPWGRCLQCGLTESAHVDTVTPYKPRRPEP